MANYSNCPKNPRNIKSQTIPTIRNPSANQNVPKITSKVSYATVEEGVDSSKSNNVTIKHAKPITITESDSFSQNSSTPGFGKINFNDLFNNDLNLDEIILKLQTIHNLVEKIHSFITKLGVPASEVLNLTNISKLNENQSSKN